MKPGLFFLTIISICTHMGTAPVWAADKPLQSIDDLRAEHIALPADTAGQLALVCDTIEQLLLLQDILNDPGAFIAPAATIRMQVHQFILPRCHALQQLRMLIRLADGIAWQRNWLLDMAEGDSSVSLPPRDSLIEEGYYEELARLAHSTRCVFANPQQQDMAAELRHLLQALGGDQILDTLPALMQDRLCADFKTVYHFLTDWRTAALHDDVQGVLEQTDVLAYLLQDGEQAYLRLTALTEAYATVCQAEYAATHPAYTPSAQLQQALLPFLQRLPALKNVLPGKQN